MAPKKKGNKKDQEDWEADLGESVAPPAPTNGDVDANGEDQDADAGGAGGLMATLRKNKERRKKKGIPENDFVDGEDPAGAAPVEEDLTVKAPEEATMEDEFALPGKKGKGAKGAKGKPAPKQDEPEEDGAGPGKVLTKAEKEKLKKEREKQRKKEQV